MSNFLIALIAAIGAGGWIYNKFQKMNGGLTQRSLTAAGSSALGIFVVLLILLSIFVKS